MNFRVLKKRFILPDKVVANGSIIEAEFGGQCTISYKTENSAYHDRFNIAHCFTLKNPQTMARLSYILRKEFGECQVVFEI